MGLSYHRAIQLRIKSRFKGSLGMKIKVKEYNSLPFEEREIIHYYTTQCIIQEIDFICNRYNDDISPRLESLLIKRRDVLESVLHKEYEEMKNEKV